eukprot:m.277984 g.277984  ORF g.277984 m.277984 type:complete len:318 (+) comp26936_c0_seq2:1009-1962(+)
MARYRTAQPPRRTLQHLRSVAAIGHPRNCIPPAGPAVCVRVRSQWPLPQFLNISDRYQTSTLDADPIVASPRLHVHRPVCTHPHSPCRCTINDMWDADLDKHVRRTANRPLASGAINHRQALVFLAGQLSVGLAVLLQLNDYSVVLGASSLALVVVYPLMKRVTVWPQAVLGLVFNWGALLGWAAVRGECDWSVVLPLYTAGWGWTMVYDTVYAHQDRADDIVVGIKSTAVRMGVDTKTWLAGFGALSIGGLTLAGINADVGLPYFLGVGAAATHAARSVYVTRLDVPHDCWRCFNQMKWGGAIVFGGAWANTLIGG